MTTFNEAMIKAIADAEVSLASISIASKTSIDSGVEPNAKTVEFIARLNRLTFEIFAMSNDIVSGCVPEITKIIGKKACEDARDRGGALAAPHCQKWEVR